MLLLFAEQQTTCKVGYIFFLSAGTHNSMNGHPWKGIASCPKKKTVLLRMHLTWCSLFDRNLGWATCKDVLGEGAPGEGRASLYFPPPFVSVLAHEEQSSHLLSMGTRGCQGHRTDPLSPLISWFVGCFLHMQVFRLELQSKNGEGTRTSTVVFVLQIETPGR